MVAKSVHGRPDVDSQAGFAGYQPFGRHPFDDSWKIFRVDPVAAQYEPFVLIWSDKTNFVRVNSFTDSHWKFLLQFPDIADFGIDFERREVSILRCSEDASQDTINHLLVDQLWPRIIGHGGELVLHAAGALTQSGVILMIGPSGAGKSTIGASLHRDGNPLLGDDAIIVKTTDRAPLCKAVYPSLRLFPDSIAKLFEGSVSHSTVSDYTSKRNVEFSSNIHHFALWHPLSAIFFLDPNMGQKRIDIERLGPSDSCMRLIQQSFSLNPFESDLAAMKVKSSSCVARSVPTYRLSYERDFSKLAELGAAMLAVLD